MRTIIIANGPERPGTEARGAFGDRYLFMNLRTVADTYRTQGLSWDDIVWMDAPDEEAVFARVLPRLAARAFGRTMVEPWVRRRTT